jgi:hypothetical protein
MLTRDQITKNIEAMEKQGAGQNDIQGYLNSLKTPTSKPQTPALTPQSSPWNTTVSQQTPETSVPQPQKEGFLSSLVKDPIKTLLVKPAVRAGQAIGAAGVYAFGNEQQKAAADRALTQDTNVSLPLLGNYNVEAVKPGMAGAKQITGEGLKAASYLYGGGEASKAKTVFGLVKQGAKVGAVQSSLAGAGQALEQNKSVEQAVTEGAQSGVAGAVLGGGIPVAGAAAKAVISKVIPKPDRIINSLIRPLLKDLSYGKNPGRAIAEEGIVANSLEDLAAKVSERRKAVGKEIASKLTSGDVVHKRLNISDTLAPIDEAMKRAQQAPRTNAALISRLKSLKADILGEVADEAGNITTTRQLDDISPHEAFKVKKLIGDITKFTGNQSDDQAANRALKRIYGGIKEKINKAVPGVDKLNEKYADLTTAEVAAKYRDKIVQRQNLIGISPKAFGIGTGIITAVATGGSAIPAVLAGVAGGALDEALSTPAVKTRVAAWLQKASPQEQAAVFRAVPGLADAVKRVIIPQLTTFGNRRTQ